MKTMELTAEEKIEKAIIDFMARGGKLVQKYFGVVTDYDDIYRASSDGCCGMGVLLIGKNQETVCQVGQLEYLAVELHKNYDWVASFMKGFDEHQYFAVHDKAGYDFGKLMWVKYGTPWWRKK